MQFKSITSVRGWGSYLKDALLSFLKGLLMLIYGLIGMPLITLFRAIVKFVKSHVIGSLAGLSISLFIVCIAIYADRTMKIRTLEWQRDSLTMKMDSMSHYDRYDQGVHDGMKKIASMQHQ